MNKPHESDSPGPAGQTAKTLSKRIADCKKFLRTDGAKDQVPAPDGNDIATQLARRARVGHIVHRGVNGYTHHASDFAALQCFARRL